MQAVRMYGELNGAVGLAVVDAVVLMGCCDDVVVIVVAMLCLFAD
jgi:hypothetical protein